MFQQNNMAKAIAGEPLTPEFLTRIGAMSASHAAPADFRPEGAWTRSYRIFTCHGYVGEGNADVGFLKLERVPQTGDFFLLRVTQQIVHYGGSLHILDGELKCRTDTLASPVEWKLESRLRDWEGNELAGLGSSESGRLNSAGIEIVRRGRAARQKVSGPVTGDFTLFEAVQRLPFVKAGPRVFDFLEGMSLYRPGHRLYYGGPPESGLHRFYHTGHGVGPYEYWLDGQHALRLVASHARAYIFDDGAEDRIRRRMEAERARSRRRPASKEPKQ